MGRHYLIGHGERLSEPIVLPRGGATPKDIYTYEESRARLQPELHSAIANLPDGTMPENISDLELLKVPTTMHGPESGPLTPAEVAERMARTDFIIEEYKTGILDEHEAGAELFHHLFPNEH